MIMLYPKVTARSLNDWNDVFNTYVNIIEYKDLAATEFNLLLIV